jgi:hypothetical protein
MVATPMSRMVVPFMASVAACAMVLVFVIQHVRREPPVHTNAATTAPAVSKQASGAQNQDSAALAAAQSEANAVAAALAGSPAPPDSGDGVPAFDIARIEPTGETVIAGRAAPGATVELLRNGELHDRAVADQSGQFAMVPPRLPPGTYDLTLRSKQPGGKLATSKQSVAVVLEPNPKERPVAALMTPDKPTVVLSQSATPKPMAGTVVVETVETEPGGKLHVSGHARPGAALGLYLNDSFVSSVKAGRMDVLRSRSTKGLYPAATASGWTRLSRFPVRCAHAPRCRSTFATLLRRQWPTFRSTEARPPLCSCRRSRPPPSPAATASGALATSTTAWARATLSFTRRTGSRFAIPT